MPVRRLNHAVLYVRDAEVTAAFYERNLGFERVGMGAPGGVFMRAPGGVFMRAPASTNDHDVAFFGIGAGAGPSLAGRSTVGLYHLAWEVQTLDELSELAQRLRSEGALVGASDHGTTKSLYARDPDGIEFEVAWIVPAALLDDAAYDARNRIGRLDLEREKQRYGATTLGGIGISEPAGAPGPA